MSDEWLSIGEAAEYIGEPVDRLFKLLEQGVIESKIPGRGVSKDSCDLWLANQKVRYDDAVEVVVSKTSPPATRAHRKVWTDDENRLLEEVYPTKPLDEVAAILGRTPQACSLQHWKIQTGYVHPPAQKTKRSKHARYAAGTDEGYSLDEAAKVLRIRTSTATKYAVSNGVEVTKVPARSGFKYRFNRAQIDALARARSGARVAKADAPPKQDVAPTPAQEEGTSEIDALTAERDALATELHTVREYLHTIQEELRTVQEERDRASYELGTALGEIAILKTPLPKKGGLIRSILGGFA
jgi:hypothetical protein